MSDVHSVSKDKTDTPRTDAYEASVSDAEILKHPHREFRDAMMFARKFERENAELLAACIEVNRCGNGGAKLSRRASDMVRAAIAKVSA